MKARRLFVFASLLFLGLFGIANVHEVRVHAADGPMCIPNIPPC